MGGKSMRRVFRPTVGRSSEGSGTRASVTLLLLAAAFSASGCKESAKSSGQADREADRSARACTEPAVHDQLKSLFFERADGILGGNSSMLGQLAGTAVVRTENARETGEDTALNVAVCEARMVIELPPGTQDAFDGARRLVADIRYGVQPVSGQKTQVHLLEGGDPIAYRLAAIDLASGLRRGPASPAPAATARAASVQRSAVPSQAQQQASAAPRASRPASGRLEPRLTTRGRPSFDCRSARSRTERIVCADERLAALDRVMASQYDAALDSTGRTGRAVLRDTRERFVARRDRCRTAPCVAAVYRERMDEIDRIASGQ